MTNFNMNQQAIDRPRNDRLTFEERKLIEKLLNDGISHTKISQILNRGKNTINVEIRRSGGDKNYNAKQAQIEADKRKDKQTKHIRYQIENNCLSKNGEVLNLHNKGFSFFEIRKQLNISVIELQAIFKHLKLYKPFLYDAYDSLDQRVFALESQVEILYEIIKGLENGKNNKL